MIDALLGILVAVAGPSGQTPPQPVAADAGKKICRAIAPTGSIMPKRFCLTKQEWKDLNTRTGDSAAETLSRGGAGKCDGQCPTSPGGQMGVQ